MPVAVARYSSGPIAIRNVLPVLWMTSCFRIMTNSHRTPYNILYYNMSVLCVIRHIQIIVAENAESPRLYKLRHL